MRKTITLVLVFSILFLSGNMYSKERKGADLIVQKTDRTQVRGELIAVKKNSLVLLERETGADAAVELKEVATIIIVKKQSLFASGGLGSLFGVIAGAAVGFSISSDKKEIEITGLMADITEVNRAFNTMTGIIVGGVFGFGVGVLAGLAAGTDKTFQIEGKSKSEIKKILEKLRKKARVRNAQ